MEYKKFWGIKQPPRKAYPKQLPDIIAHFYRRKPFRARLDITIEEMQMVLRLTTTEASELVKIIKTQPYSTDLPFVTIKEFARYTKLNSWQVHHYFICDLVYEDLRIREERKGRHH